MDKTDSTRANKSGQLLPRISEERLQHLIAAANPHMDISRPEARAILDELHRLRRSDDGVRENLAALVSKLDAVDAHGGMRAAFATAANHGFVYTGPHYVEELKAARASLSERPASKIIAGLKDAVAFAKGDKTKGRLTTFYAKGPFAYLLKPHGLAEDDWSLGDDPGDPAFVESVPLYELSGQPPEHALISAVIKAAQQFRSYEREHRKKAEDFNTMGRIGEAVAASDKAKTNQTFAEMCEAALAVDPNTDSATTLPSPRTWDIFTDQGGGTCLRLTFADTQDASIVLSALRPRAK